MPEGEKKPTKSGGLSSGMTAAPRRVHIDDLRKVSGATGQPIQQPRTGDYDYETIEAIAKAAIEQGLDPYDALAIGMQESGFGNAGGDAATNIGQVNYNRMKNDPAKRGLYDGLMQNMRGATGKTAEAKSLAYMLKHSLSQADQEGYSDPAYRLQAYNGYGKIGKNNDIGAKQLYGIDLTQNEIDMRKNPLYGKTVLDVRDNILKKNADIQGLVSGLMPRASAPQGDMSGVSVSVVPTAGGKAKFQFNQNGKIIKEAEGDYNNYMSLNDKGSFLKSLYAGQ